MSEFRKEELLKVAYELRKSCGYSSIIDAYVLRKINPIEIAEMLEEYASKKEIEPIE